MSDATMKGAAMNGVMAGGVRKNDRKPRLLSAITTLSSVLVAFFAIALCMLSLLLLATPLARAASLQSIDLGNYSLSNPQITLVYTEPVQLIAKTLIATDPKMVPHEYALCMNSTDMQRTIYLYTKESGSGQCDGAAHPLSPGKYRISLQAIDKDGISTDPPIDVREFSVVGLDVVLTTPRSGVSTTQMRNLTFTTLDSMTPTLAVCHVGTILKSFDDLALTAEGSTPSTTHTVVNFDRRGDFFIICRDDSGREVGKNYTLDWELAPPKITVQLDPAKVVDPNKEWESFIVSTDIKTYCELDGKPFMNADGTPEDKTAYVQYVMSHATIQTYDVQSDKEYQFTHTITCYGRSGLFNATSVNVTVDLRESADIQVISPPSPEPGFTRTSNFTFMVHPLFAATGCTLRYKGNTDPMDAAPDNNFVTQVPTLPDGSYSFAISCAGTNKSAARTYNITIDTTGPPAPSIFGGDMLCGGGKIRVHFNTSDPAGRVSYNYTLQDDQGVLLQNSTVANDVEARILRRPATMRWDVVATDPLGNVGPVASKTVDNLTIGEDEQCGLPPFITLVQPNMGYSTSKPYTVQLRTPRSSVCKYAFNDSDAGNFSTMLPFSVSDGLTHTRNNLLLTAATMFVQCNEPDGSAHHKQFAIGVDNTAPKISILLRPDFVNDAQQQVVLMTVTTDDRTYCTHTSTYGPRFDQQPDGTFPDPAQQGAYTSTHTTALDYRAIAKGQDSFSVTCRNLAWLVNTSYAIVGIDTKLSMNITVLSPSAYVATPTVPLVVHPSKISTCQWQEAGANSSGAQGTFSEMNGTHTADLGALAEGSHSYLITCTTNDGTDEATRSYTFTVDRTAPVLDGLSGRSELCPGDTASYVYNITSLDRNVVVAVTLERTDNTGGVEFAQNITSGAALTIGAQTTNSLGAGEYALRFTPTGSNNISGTTVELKITVHASTDDICTVEQGHCTNKKLDPGENNIDCGGTCPNECVSCTDDNGCIGTQSCMSGVCVNTNACQTDNQCKRGRVCIVGLCQSKPCTTSAECNGAQCVQGLCDSKACETELDCDANEECSAGACTPLVTCSQDDQCTDPKKCVSGVCKVPSVPSPPVNNNITQGGCSLQTDCATDELCQNNVCVKKIEKTPVCNSNADCTGEGETCQNNVCALAPASSHLTAWILVLVGILLSGGAGYYLYVQDQEKSSYIGASYTAPYAGERSQQTQQSPSRYAQSSYEQAGPKKVVIAPPLDAPAQETGNAPGAPGEQNAGSSSGKTTTTPSSYPSYADKTKKRNAFFDAFDNRVEGNTTSAAATDSTTTTMKKTDDSSVVPKKDDEFIDLSDLQKKKTAIKSNNKKGSKDNDAFGELDKLNKRD